MNLNKMNKQDEWYTPKKIVDLFGKFDLDAASNEYNAKRLGIDKYYSKENSALDKEWKGKVWLNPPFTMKEEFIKKAREQVDKGNCEVYLLLPMRMETKIVHKYLMGRAVIYIPNGRIQFEKENEIIKKSPNFASVVFKLTKHKTNEYQTINIK